MPHIAHGTIISFDASTYTAQVVLDGADAQCPIAVGQWVDTTSLAASVECAVLLFDANNPSDALVLGAYGGVGGAPTFTTVNATTQYNKSGTKVVGARQTGWAAWTGTPTRTTKATSTATLVNVAEALKALIDDLIAHGLIGP